MHIKIGTFNLLNLARPGERYYEGEPPYSAEEFAAKAAWAAGQLERMDADVVGFQEVFHAEALRAVCGAAYPEVVAPGADGASGPRVGLASRLPLAGPVESITAFPDGLDVPAEGVALPPGRFSRPVLRARVALDARTTVAVYVVHLKSKRPVRVEGAPADDPREEALGKARSLVRRAAEAAALRFLLLEDFARTRQPALVLGDLNDGPRAVTTDIVMGDPRARERLDREVYRDRSLYSAQDIDARRTGWDVGYSHVHNGHYETLDHILVSEEFHAENPDRVGEVALLRHFNDHLVDGERPHRTASDHAQLVAEIRLLPPP